MIPDLKYTDEDVRREGELQRRAESYALHYKADFPFLVQAHDMMSRNGYLTTGVARGVLNCMRLDARIAETLPQPGGHTMANAARPLRVVRAHPRNVFIRPTVLKRPYLISLHRTARTVHSVDTAYTGFVYAYDDTGKLTNVISRARGICCVTYPKYLLLSEERALSLTEDDAYKMCQRCVFHGDN